LATLASFLQDVNRSFAEQRKAHEEIVKKLEAPFESPPAENESAGERSTALSVLRAEVARLKRAIDLRINVITGYPDLLVRLCFIYTVALFDAFMSDALQILLASRPEVMRSSKKHLSYEHILRMNETGNLISFMAQREVNELSYKAIQDQVQYWRERLGIDLEESGISAARLSEIIDVRII